MTEINKLRDALMLIKKECESQGDTCSTCPLFIEDGVHALCGVVGRDTGIAHDSYKAKPKYWKLPRVRLMVAPKDKD